MERGTVRTNVRPGGLGAAVVLLVLAGCTAGTPSAAPAALIDVTGQQDAAPDLPVDPAPADGDRDDAPAQDAARPDAASELGDRAVAGNGSGHDRDGAAGATLVDPTDRQVDHARLDAVVNDLLRLRGAVLRDVLRRPTGTPMTEHDAQRLRAIVGGRRLIETTQAFQRYAHDEDQRSQLLPLAELGRPTWVSERTVHAEPACVVVIGSYDLSAVAVTPFDADERTVITLGRMSDEQLADLGGRNPSGWRIEEVVRLVTRDTGEPIPRREWDGLDYAGSMALDPCDDVEAST